MAPKARKSLAELRAQADREAERHRAKAQQIREKALLLEITAALKKHPEHAPSVREQLQRLGVQFAELALEPVKKEGESEAANASGLAPPVPGEASPVAEEASEVASAAGSSSGLIGFAPERF